MQTFAEYIEVTQTEHKNGRWRIYAAQPALAY